MAIKPCPDCYTEELLEMYPFLSHIPIYTGSYEDFVKLDISDALAATNYKSIIIREDLNPHYFRHGLIHECEHIRLGPNASEAMVEASALRRSGLPYYLFD